MSSKANVTTPGGFFIGLGGIVCFSLVAAVVWWWVKSPAANTELRPQQIALGLRLADGAKDEDVKKKGKETSDLLTKAKNRYNGGAEPDLDKLDDLRGVIRFREADKLKAEAEKALVAAPAWKDKAKGDVTMPINLAMNVVSAGLKDRKPKASAVKVDAMIALDPNAAPLMPNAMGGGAKTVIFADLNPPAPPAPVPAAAPAPASPAPANPAPVNPPPAPAPGAPVAPAPAPAPATPAPAPAPVAPPAAPSTNGASAASPQPAVAVAAPVRPTLLNWPESKK